MYKTELKFEKYERVAPQRYGEYNCRDASASASRRLLTWASPTPSLPHHSTTNPPHCSLIHQPIPSLIHIDGCHRFLCFLMEYPADNGKLTTFCLESPFVPFVRLFKRCNLVVSVQYLVLYRFILFAFEWSVRKRMLIQFTSLYRDSLQTYYIIISFYQQPYKHLLYISAERFYRYHIPFYNRWESLELF